MKAVLAASALAVAALALAPAASAGPVDDALYTANVTVLCALIVVDGLMVNTVGPMAGGSYPGRSAVQGVIMLLGPGGTVGGPVNGVGRTLGQAWDNGFRTATETLRSAEILVAEATATAAGAAQDGYDGAHDLKCWATHSVLFPAWYGTGRPWFCWAWGGPESCSGEAGQYVLLLGYAQCTLKPGGSLVVAHFCGTPPLKPFP
jgi:hypothetical protein